MTQEFIQTHLSIDQQYTKRISKDNPIKSKDDFYKVLKWWKTLSKKNTISNTETEEHANNTPWIHVKIDSNQYFLNADTNRDGVIEFLKNIENAWLIIKNERGVDNKITNRTDRLPIPGFYFYKVI